MNKSPRSTPEEGRPSLNRRTLFAGASTVGALAAAATLLPRVGPEDAAAVAEPASEELDVADVGVLHLAGEGVAGLEAAERAEQAAQGALGVHRAERAGRIERRRLAALAEQAALDLADQAAGGGGVVETADIGWAVVLGAELFADPRAAVFFVEVVDHEVGAEFIGRREAEGHAAAP